MDLKTFVNDDRILNRIEHYVKLNDDFDRNLYYTIFSNTDDLVALVKKAYKRQNKGFTLDGETQLHQRIEHFLSIEDWTLLAKVRVGEKYIKED